MTGQQHHGFTLIELMIVVTIIGILAAIAIPSFIRFQSRSKQAEAKSNLKAAFTAEKAYFADRDSYTNLITAIGFSVERGNRYCYDLGGGSGGVWQQRSTTTESADSMPPSQTGITADTFKYQNTGISSVMPAAFNATVATGTAGSFTATASSNIDHDDTYDQWSISSLTRSSAASSDATASCASGNNPGGDPCNDLNDVIN